MSNQPQQPPCSQPEARQFDFWVGDWDATWGPEGQGKGTNSITKDEYGDCVIYERFDADPTGPLKGMSVSIYDQRDGKWRQTWVDNQGGYYDLVGEFKNGEMHLIHEIPGSDKLNRMRFYNIEEDSFDWDWEGSPDQGETWNVLWSIHYTRKK